MDFSTSYKPKPMFHNPKQKIFIEFQKSMKVRCEGHEKFGLSFRVETKILYVWDPMTSTSICSCLGQRLEYFVFKTARHEIIAWACGIKLGIFHVSKLHVVQDLSIIQLVLSKALNDLRLMCPTLQATLSKPLGSLRTNCPILFFFFNATNECKKNHSFLTFNFIYF